MRASRSVSSKPLKLRFHIAFKPEVSSLADAFAAYGELPAVR